MVRRIGAVMLLLLAGAGGAHGQSIDLGLKNLGVSEFTRSYLQPAADALGYALNTGISRTPTVGKRLNVSIGVVGVWTFIPEVNRSFTTTVPQDLQDNGYPASVTTATIFGNEGATLTSTHSGVPALTLPSGINQQQVFLVAPQFEIGPLAATQFVLRGMPPTSYDPSIGKIAFVAGGLKHCFTQYARLPVDLALVATAQFLHVENAMDQSGYNVMLQAGLRIPVVTLTGSIGYEGYKSTVSYTYEPPVTPPPGYEVPEHVSMDFEGRNLRFRVGALLRLLPVFDLSAEYGFGEQNSLAVGAFLTL
jgi:hypothetical protein